LKKRKYSVRKYIVPEYIKKSLELLKPPEELTVSEWAGKYRFLDERSSSMPGKWKNEMTPYLVGIMDEFNNYQTEKIVFCKCTQLGGTEALNNMICFSVAQDPAPMMIVYPTSELADSVVEQRIKPMLKASKETKKHFKEKNSSKKELQFDNMYISIVGSNSPSELASRPIRYLFLDEVDKYPNESKKEADPISLAVERTKTFNNRKIYMCSTPTTRTGHIWEEKEKAADLHQKLIEAAAENDEGLMEKFFDQGILTEDEMREGIRKGLITRSMFPVFCVSALRDMGVRRMMEFLGNVVPFVSEMPKPVTTDGIEVAPDAKGPTSLYFFSA